MSADASARCSKPGRSCHCRMLEPLKAEAKKRQVATQLAGKDRDGFPVRSVPTVPEEPKESGEEYGRGKVPTVPKEPIETASGRLSPVPTVPEGPGESGEEAARWRFSRSYSSGGTGRIRRSRRPCGAGAHGSRQSKNDRARLAAQRGGILDHVPDATGKPRPRAYKRRSAPTRYPGKGGGMNAAFITNPWAA